MSDGGWRHDRRWRWGIGALTVCAVLSLVGAWRAGADPAAATVLGLFWAIPGVLLTAWQQRQAPEADIEQLAESLARKSKRRCGLQQRQMLGAGGRTIDLGFDVENQPPSMAAAPRLLRQMGDIVAFYQALQPRRLVITGSPGAGKTFMAVELVLGLLTHADRSQTDPVPVRLTLTDWDIGTNFEVWLAKRIAKEFGVSLSSARALVAARRVLPVLDGLDEMDAAADPHAATPRAIAAAEALNHYLDGKIGAPFVLVCRSWRYRALIASGHRVVEAARIQIAPVTASQARTYLAERREHARFPDRWSTLVNMLGQEIHAAPPDWLSTPWRLTMVATAYARDGNPSELIVRARDGIVDEYLLNLYVPGAIAMHPLDREGRYSERDTTLWLTELARYLRATGKQSIVLHELWGLGRGWQARAVAGSVGTLLGTLTFLLLTYSDRSDDPYPPRPYAIPVAVFVGLTLGAFASFDSSGPRVLHLTRVALRFEAVAAFRDALRRCLLLLIGAAVGLAATVWAYGNWPALHNGLQTSIGRGGPPFWPNRLVSLLALSVLLSPALLFLGACYYTLVSGVAAATGRRPVLASLHSASMEATDPRAPLRRILLTGAGTAGVLIVLGIASFTLFPVWARIVVWMPLYVLGLAPIAEAARWITWSLTFRIWARGRLPMRTGAFLDWACQAGLLRISGHAYEFRHRELQDWLMARPSQPSSSAH